MKRILSTLACLSFALPVFANISTINNFFIAKQWLPLHLSVGVYGGYGASSGAYQQDGQATQGRLAFGLSTPQNNNLSLGAEAGVQSGNTMRLYASPALITTAGGLPIQSTLKPFVDFLLTARGKILPNAPLYAMLKGGIAYRQLTLDDRTSSQDGLRQVNGEFQAGLAYSLTDRATVTAFYQGIYAGNNAGLNLDSAGNVTISRIPTQQAGFLGVEYAV